MTHAPQIEFALFTDVGMRRANNQDSCVARPCRTADEWARCGHLFLVADGMGGHAVGDLASRIASETLPHSFMKSQKTDVKLRLADSLVDANRAIHERGTQNAEFTNMGTTCTALALTPEGATIGHAGDSRAYRVRGNRIEQLTFDHSLQWEVVRQGAATMANVDLLHPRNVITRCLGPNPNVNVDVEGPFPVVPGDRFLVCSDGLTNHVSDDEIGVILKHLRPTDASRLLVHLANSRGGADNSSVVVIQVDQYPMHPMWNSGPVETRRDAPEKVNTPFHWRPWASAIFGASAITSLLLIAFDRSFAGILLGFVSMLMGLLRLAAGSPTTALVEEETAAIAATDPAEIDQIELSDSSDESSGDSSIAMVSPYRITELPPAGGLLEELARLQSSLIQAARENGWDAEFSKLTAMSQQAAEEEGAGDVSKSLDIRARIISRLMRLLYNHVRGPRRIDEDDQEVQPAEVSNAAFNGSPEE